MQFSAVFSFLATLAVATASALPATEARAVREGECGLDTYNNAYFCIINGVVSCLPACLSRHDQLGWC